MEIAKIYQPELDWLKKRVIESLEMYIPLNCLSLKIHHKIT